MVSDSQGQSIISQIDGFIVITIHFFLVELLLCYWSARGFHITSGNDAMTRTVKLPTSQGPGC